MTILTSIFAGMVVYFALLALALYLHDERQWRQTWLMVAIFILLLPAYTVGSLCKIPYHYTRGVRQLWRDCRDKDLDRYQPSDHGVVRNHSEEAV